MVFSFEKEKFFVVGLTSGKVKGWLRVNFDEKKDVEKFCGASRRVALLCFLDQLPSFQRCFCLSSFATNFLDYFFLVPSAEEKAKSERYALHPRGIHSICVTWFNSSSDHYGLSLLWTVLCLYIYLFLYVMRISLTIFYSCSLNYLNLFFFSYILNRYIYVTHMYM